MKILFLTLSVMFLGIGCDSNDCNMTEAQVHDLLLSCKKGGVSPEICCASLQTDQCKQSCFELSKKFDDCRQPDASNRPYGDYQDVDCCNQVLAGLGIDGEDLCKPNSTPWSAHAADDEAGSF